MSVNLLPAKRRVGDARNSNTTDPASGRKGKEVVGEVVSNRMKKTIVVSGRAQEVARVLWPRVFSKAKRFTPTMKKNEARIGDAVRLEETRPLSETEALAAQADCLQDRALVPEISAEVNVSRYASAEPQETELWPMSSDGEELGSRSPITPVPVNCGGHSALGGSTGPRAGLGAGHRQRERSLSRRAVKKGTVAR